jgi:hypothetical protein
MSKTPSLKGFGYGNSLESAFADHTPWIQNTTIRQNIVGLSVFDGSWYEEVTGACSLDYDIAALPDSHGMCTYLNLSKSLVLNNPRNHCWKSRHFLKWLPEAARRTCTCIILEEGAYNN